MFLIVKSRRNGPYSLVFSSSRGTHEVCRKNTAIPQYISCLCVSGEVFNHEVHKYKRVHFERANV